MKGVETMKRYHFWPLFVAVAFAHSLLATVITVTDANLANYTGATEISIEAGDTLQFSGITSAYTLSAPISGGGTLLIDGCTGTATLAGDNSSFSGSLVVTNSSVTVGHVHALGSATVSIVTDSADERKYLMSGFADMPKRSYGKGQGVARILGSGKKWEVPHFYETPWFNE